MLMKHARNAKLISDHISEGFSLKILSPTDLLQAGFILSVITSFELRRIMYISFFRKSTLLSFVKQCGGRELSI